MKVDLKPFPWITLGVGFLIYLWIVLNNDITNQNFVYGALTLMITLSIWICLHLIMDSFDINDFGTILSISGYIFAITVLFFFGLEEVSYPAGAIVFKAEGIAQALAIALIASIPILKRYTISQNTTDPSSDDDNWEPATEEDLNSGDFDLDN